LLYRYDPRRSDQGDNPLQLDSRSPKATVEQSMYNENRFKMLTRTKPEDAKRLLQEAQSDVNTRWQMYQYLAARHTNGKDNGKTNGTDHSGSPSTTPESAKP